MSTKIQKVLPWLPVLLRGRVPVLPGMVAGWECQLLGRLRGKRIASAGETSLSHIRQSFLKEKKVVKKAGDSGRALTRCTQGTYKIQTHTNAHIQAHRRTYIQTHKHTLHRHKVGS